MSKRGNFDAEKMRKPSLVGIRSSKRTGPRAARASWSLTRFCSATSRGENIGVLLANGEARVVREAAVEAAVRQDETTLEILDEEHDGEPSMMAWSSVWLRASCSWLLLCLVIS